MTQFNYSAYLNNLSEIEKKHAPKELFLEGNTSLLFEGRRVSVVGSRKISKHGIARTEIITKALIEHGITIVSGLAEGIDTVAHETAIYNGGKTIAVLNTPLSKVYPAKNRDLLNQIKKDYLAISQFPENYPSQKSNSPIRNRTMALISDATIIIEAGEKSGTRYQGWEALRLGRQLFLMQNVAEDNSLTWPREMISYGAQVLTRDNYLKIMDDIQFFTASVFVEFSY